MEYLSYVIMAFEVLVVIGSIVISIIKTKKARASGVTTESATMTSKILAMIPNLVIQAEEMFGAGKGANKLSWALQQVTIEALKEGFTVDNDTVTNAINAVVEATNKVNITRIEN